MIVPMGVKYIYYILMTTSNCNLRCAYCFENWKHKTSSLVKPMTEQFIEDLVPFIMETKDPNREINFEMFGGEPTLNWKFIERFIERISSLNFKKYFSITTNCVLLDTQKIEYLLSNFAIINISIDGTRDANINRIDAEGKGTWDKSISNAIEIISKSKFRKTSSIGTMMVVNNKNYKYIEESYDLLVNKLLVDDFDILFDYEAEISQEYLEEIKRQLISMFVIKRWKLPRTIARKSLNRDFIEKKNFFCYHPELVTAIDSSGRLFFCHLQAPKFEGQEIKKTYGDIYKGIYNLNFYNEMINRTNFSEWKVGKECENCSASGWCKGGCLSAHYLLSESRDFDTLNQSQCRIHKIIDEVSKEIMGGQK